MPKKQSSLYRLYSLIWDVGPLFWALLEVQSGLKDRIYGLGTYLLDSTVSGPSGIESFWPLKSGQLTEQVPFRGQHWQCAERPVSHPRLDEGPDPKGQKYLTIWMVVKIMVPFWVPEILGAVLY